MVRVFAAGYAATEADNRTSFRAAIELAKKADEEINAYTQKSPPTETDLTSVLAAVKAVTAQENIEAGFLRKLHAGLPEAFGNLRGGSFLLAKGFEKRNNDLIRSGAGMVAEWQKFWAAHRREIALALSASETEEWWLEMERQNNAASVRRILSGTDRSGQQAMVYAAVTLGSLLIAWGAGWWLFQSGHTARIKAVLYSGLQAGAAFTGCLLYIGISGVVLGIGIFISRVLYGWLF